jgi:hypothetical protein
MELRPCRGKTTMSKSSELVERQFEQLGAANRLLTLSREDREFVWANLKMWADYREPIKSQHEPVSKPHDIVKLSRKLADAVEGHLFAAPLKGIYGEPLEAFIELPRVLRLFARQINRYEKLVGKSGYPPPSTATMCLVLASELVKHSLGSYVDEDVAELAQLFDPKTERPTVSGEAIKKRRDRLRKDFPELHAWLVQSL